MDCQDKEMLDELRLWEYREQVMHQNELLYGNWKITDLCTLLFEISLIHGSAIFQELFDLLNSSGLLVEGEYQIKSIAQSVINILGRSAILNATTLRLFRNLQIVFLDLTRCGDKLSELLPLLLLPNSFHQLESLNLSATKFDPELLRNLKNLPLTRLNLSSTGLQSTDIVHILPIRFTLLDLRLDNNPSLGNESLPLLNQFKSLVTLDLYGTSITLETPSLAPPASGLRNFIARAYAIQPYLTSISPPQPIRDWISSQATIDVPPPAIGIDQLDNLTNSKLKAILSQLVPGIEIPHRRNKVLTHLKYLMYRRIDNERCLEIMSEERIAEASKTWEG